MFNGKIKTWIENRLDYDEILQVKGGLSGSQTYLVKTDNKKHYLKIKKNDISNELLYESEMFEFLDKKLKVPKTKFIETYEDYTIHCMTELKGELYENMLEDMGTTEFIKGYAEALKNLHSIDISGCSVNNILDKRLHDIKIRLADYDLEKKCSYYDYLKGETKSISKRDIYKYLLNNKPFRDEHRVTHGNYSFDNIISENETIKYLDLGRGGVADRYQDIALAVKSVHEDLGKEWINTFYEYYGIKNVDKEKINYYILLDEFF